METQRSSGVKFWTLIVLFTVLGSATLGAYLMAAPANVNRFYPGGLSLVTGGDGYSIGSDVQLSRSAANIWTLGAGDSLIGISDLNATDVHASNLYANSTVINGNQYYAELPISYTIWNSSGTIYSRNEKTGVVTTGTDSATVIQAAYDSMCLSINTRGILHLKAGLYYLTKTLNFTTNALCFEGEGMGYANAGTMLQSTGDRNMFNIGTGTFASGHGYYFKDLYLYGNLKLTTADSSLIKISNNVHDSYFENILMITGGYTGKCFSSRIAAPDTHNIGFVNVWFEGADRGIDLGGVAHSFTQCRFASNNYGVFDGSSRTTYTACLWESNIKDGYYGSSSIGNTITGCELYNNNVNDLASYGDIKLDGGTYIITGNSFRYVHQDWAITTVNAANGNVIKNNKYYNYPVAVILANVGDILHIQSYQFTEAIAGAISTTSPVGVDVDGSMEGALAWGQIPKDSQQIIRINVWAVSTGTPIGAGGQMHFNATLNAGSANAAYNTASKSWALTTFDGEDADYTANDVIHWVIEDGDVGNELRALLAGDSFEFFAYYCPGADPDGATDCVIRCIEVEYV